ncbi:hypothetical protein ACVWWN_003400 [Mycobacterium sp. URHB0021]|jgi:hypothetical protein
MVLSVVEPVLAANAEAGEWISAAGSADPAATLRALGATVGPIGATFLAGYGLAEATNLAGTLRCGAVHAAIGGARDAAPTLFTAADEA